MRLLFVIIFITVCQVACRHQIQTPCSRMQDSLMIDNLQFKFQVKSDSVNRLRLQLDSAKTRAFVANYKIEKVRFYLGLATKNKSQEKFLKGWINRSIN